MHAIVLLTEPAGCERVGGLPCWSRLVRTLRQLGVETIQLLVSPALKPSLPAELDRGRRDRAEVALLADDRPTPSTEQLLDRLPREVEELVIVPADRIIDPRILAELLRRPGAQALIDSAPPSDQSRLLAAAPRLAGGLLCGPIRLHRGWLEQRPGGLAERLAAGVEEGSIAALDVARMPTYAANLRRHLRPFWCPAPSDPAARAEARRLLLEATQKGALDIPALAHAPIEKRLAWPLASTRITPNQITVVTNLVAWTATYLFASGRLGWGLAAALAVGVLDGVDGKLARLRLETSKLGELEHWFDFLYEWSWWTALAFHLSSSGLLPNAWHCLGLLALAELADGVAKWINLRTFGCTIDEMGRFDRWIRWVGGRRNVYIWVLAAAALLGRAPAAFALLPWLEGLTAGVHWVRLGWLLRHRKRAVAVETPTP